MSELSRREFLAAAVAVVPPRNAYFGLHPFIEANPKAVFVHRTHVKEKMDSAGKREAGLTLARQILVPMQRGGIPITHRIILKPNQTSVRDRLRPDVEHWGTGTDPDFYEGFVMRLKELGARKMYFIEVNMRERWNWRGRELDQAGPGGTKAILAIMFRCRPV